MKSTTRTLALVGLVAAFALSAATPAQARWWDGHEYHRGPVPHGWVYDPRLHYYVYGAPVVVAPPPAVIVTQPAPPPVVIAQPAPVYEPAPVGLSLGVHIR